MIELVVFACLIAAPDQCRHERIGYAEGNSPEAMVACVMASQPSAARWASENPRRVIMQVVCRKALDEA